MHADYSQRGAPIRIAVFDDKAGVVTCGDETAFHCISTEVTVTAAIAAEIAVLGIEIEVGGAINVTCYRGLRKD